MYFIKGYFTGFLLCLFTGFFVLSGGSAYARPPHNDPYNNSVKQVISFHSTSEAHPESIKYLSWGPVHQIDNGTYKVVVVFLSRNRYERRVKKKQIIILNETGRILKILDCR
ncbi:MAG: hypothetical protein U9P10_01410 [Thermodesulfobacteriota bacterium]|nr:hypothetical protein [Thermodesulfobacteriota bacterium]